MSYGGGPGGPNNYGQPQQRSSVVFVGNLPFDYTEEQLTEVFSSVGPVVSFRLVFDHNTGRPKGFGFCEYRDPETAASALRNLQGVEVGGRGLRLDFADTEDAPPSKRRGPPQRGPPGAGAGAGADYAGGPGAGAGFNGARGGADDARPLPAGAPLAPGQQATDAISHTLGTMPPGQLLDIMSQMKALVTASPFEARALLTANPQLSYALFQAMLMMNIVDPGTLSKMLPQAPVPVAGPPVTSTPPYGGPAATNTPPYGGPPASYGGPPVSQQPPFGGPGGYQGPPPMGYPPNQPTPPPGHQRGYGGLPPPGPAGPPPGAAPQVAPEQAALIQQVLSMTQEQIDALPAESRNTIMQIRAQAGLGARR